MLLGEVRFSCLCDDVSFLRCLCAGCLASNAPQQYIPHICMAGCDPLAHSSLTHYSCRDCLAALSVLVRGLAACAPVACRNVLLHGWRLWLLVHAPETGPYIHRRCLGRMMVGLLCTRPRLAECWHGTGHHTMCAAVGCIRGSHRQAQLLPHLCTHLCNARRSPMPVGWLL